MTANAPSAAPWPGLRLRHEAGATQFKVNISKFKVQAPDPMAQLFKSPGLGDARPLGKVNF